MTKHKVMLVAPLPRQREPFNALFASRPQRSNPDFILSCLYKLYIFVTLKLINLSTVQKRPCFPFRGKVSRPRWNFMALFFPALAHFSEEKPL